MSNSIWMTVIKGNVDDNNRKVGVFHMFEVELKVHDVDGERRISLSVSPLEAAGGTAMLVECRLSIGREQIKIDRDVWCEEEIDIFSTPVAGCSGTIQLECSLIEFLPVVELSQQTPYRRFQVLCAPDSYFVDPFRLGQVGGALFTEWATKAEEDETRVVCQLDNVELQVLLEAVIGYESIVVHRRNFRRLCDVAERFKIVALLRSIESYLMESSMHPMRRLEYAVEMRMARLFDSALREMGSPYQIIDKLHEYLLETGGTMNDVHPKLLSSLNITKDYICIS